MSGVFLSRWQSSDRCQFPCRSVHQQQRRSRGRSSDQTHGRLAVQRVGCAGTLQWEAAARRQTMGKWQTDSDRSALTLLLLSLLACLCVSFRFPFLASFLHHHAAVSQTTRIRIPRSHPVRSVSVHTDSNRQRDSDQPACQGSLGEAALRRGPAMAAACDGSCNYSRCNESNARRGCNGTAADTDPPPDSVWICLPPPSSYCVSFCSLVSLLFL